MSSETRRRPFAKSPPEDEAGDGLWNAYLDAVEDQDKASVESWNGSTTGILTFTGLFAATVAAFVIESYKQLQPDTGAQTVALLAQLVSASSTTPTIPSFELPSEPFAAPETAVIVNTLWFLSLIISLVCALLATLIQEWTRDFLRDIQHRTPDMTLREYSFNHIHVRMGVEQFKLDYVTSIIIALMHLAVILFLVGLVMFLGPIHPMPAFAVKVAGIIAASIYGIFSIMPFFDNSCPYRTPLTYVFVVLGWTISWILWAMISAILLVAVYALVYGLISMLLFAVGVPLFVLGSLAIILQLAFDNIFGSGDFDWFKEMSELWTSLSELWPIVLDLLPLLQGIIDLVLFLLGILRFLLYASLPTRHLPGRLDIPVHMLNYGSNEDTTKERPFVSDKRLLFLWGHTSKYLFGPEGSTILWNHLPHRLLNFSKRDYGLFFAYLRHNDAFMERFACVMGTIESLDTGLGVLKLLQMLIRAEHGLEYKVEPDRGARWNTMNQYNLPDAFPAFVQKVLQHGGDVEAHANVLIRISEFRWTLILVRFLLFPNMDREDWTKNMQLLNGMLLSLEGIKGMGLIPLYMDSQDLSDQKFDEYHDSEDTAWGYELAIQNTLTLLVNLIHLDNDDTLGRGKIETVMTAWRNLSTDKEFKKFSEASRRRQPSNQLLSLFFSHTHTYEDELNQFSNLFTLPNPGPPQLFRLELEADQTLRDLDFVFRRGSITSPQRQDPDHEPGAKEDTSKIQVVLSNHELEKLGIRIIIAHETPPDRVLPIAYPAPTLPCIPSLPDPEHQQEGLHEADRTNNASDEPGINPEVSQTVLVTDMGRPPSPPEEDNGTDGPTDAREIQKPSSLFPFSSFIECSHIGEEMLSNMERRGLATGSFTTPPGSLHQDVANSAATSSPKLHMLQLGGHSAVKKTGSQTPVENEEEPPSSPFLRRAEEGAFDTESPKTAEKKEVREK